MLFLILPVLILINKSDAQLVDENREFKTAVTIPPTHDKDRWLWEQENIEHLWPLAVVPYSTDVRSYDDILNKRLRYAMNVIEHASCVKFQPVLVRPEYGSWINITAPTSSRECVHEVHRKDDGEIVLELGYDCLKMTQLTHSLLHAIGFKDEVTHPNRDQYINVQWDNILPAYRHLFRLQELEKGHRVLEYDPMSIMHFHDRAFSSNGKATVLPMLPGLLINPSHHLSQLDKLKLELMFKYECNNRNVRALMHSCQNVLHKEEKQKQKHLEKFQGQENNATGKAAKLMGMAPIDTKRDVLQKIKSDENNEEVDKNGGDDAEENNGDEGSDNQEPDNRKLANAEPDNQEFGNQEPHNQEAGNLEAGKESPEALENLFGEDNADAV